jgi:hypothetical protein
MLGCLTGLGLALALLVPAETTPASVAQAAQAVDLSKLQFPNEIKIGQKSPIKLVANGPAQVKEWVRDLTDQLTKVGCKRLADPAGTTPSDEYAAVSFEKDGFSIYLTMSTSDAGKTTLLTISNLGNVNTSKLPATESAKVIFESPQTKMFTTAGSVADAGKEVDRLLSKAGWRRVRRIDGSQPPEDQFLQWEYLHHGILLSVYVSVAPAQGNKTMVQYGTSMAENDFIVPEDVGPFQYTDFPFLELLCRSSMPKEKLIDFYLAELPKVGWTHRADKGYRKDEAVMLMFDRPSRAMYVHLAPKEGQTEIHAQEIDPELLKEPKPQPKPQMKEKELPLVSIPIPKGANNITWKDDQSEVTFKSKSSPKDLLKVYSSFLEADEWKMDKLGSILTEFGGSVEFEKDRQSISIRFFKDVFEGATEVNVAGSGVRLEQAKK